MFGEDPELYDRARPGYRAEVVDDVLGFAMLGAGTGKALEIGAGTGKATVSFAARGLRVHALEPDPAMAAVAVRNCSRYPRVDVEVSRFEDWRLPGAGFDLVYSAQAWHWIDPEVRCARAAAVLVPGGCLALLWHRVHWPENDRFRAALDHCYRRHAPGLLARGPGFPGLTPSNLDAAVRSELSGCPAFTSVTVHSHPWSETFDASAYTDRLRTQSDHRLLSHDQLEELLAAVGDVIAAAGGEVSVPHSTLVVLARRVAESGVG